MQVKLWVLGMHAQSIIGQYPGVQLDSAAVQGRPAGAANL